MERELIISLNNKSYDKKKINAEIEEIKKMLPYIESFKGFAQNNEIFDICNRRIIKRRHKLMNIYSEGTGKNVFCFVLCKN